MNLSFELTIFEQQSYKQGAGGSAHQYEYDAYPIPGIPRKLGIPGLDKITASHSDVYEATNLAKTVTNMVEPDREQILERYKKENLGQCEAQRQIRSLTYDINQVLVPVRIRLSHINNREFSVRALNFNPFSTKPAFVDRKSLCINPGEETLFRIFRLT